MMPGGDGGASKVKGQQYSGGRRWDAGCWWGELPALAKQPHLQAPALGMGEIRHLPSTCPPGGQVRADHEGRALPLGKICCKSLDGCLALLRGHVAVVAGRVQPVLLQEVVGCRGEIGLKCNGIQYSRMLNLGVDEG
jgi:hypothetical protein